MTKMPETAGLNGEQLLDVYYKMLLARTVGQRERMINRMGKGPFAVTGEGHEALQVGTAYALKPGHDWIVPYYRDIGVALTIGQTPRDLLLAHLSRAEDISSGGRNMPSHLLPPPPPPPPLGRGATPGGGGAPTPPPPPPPPQQSLVGGPPPGAFWGGGSLKC